MKLHVLTYAHVSNPHGIPAEWPAQVREVAADAPGPESPWVRMTLAEYADYRSAHQEAYDAWAATQPAAAAPSPRWTPLEFLQRFTAAERAAVRASTDPDVQDFADLLRASGEVAAEHPITIQGLNLMVALDLITPSRAAQILTAEPSP